MSNITFKQINLLDDQEIEKVFFIMNELRPLLTLESYKKLIHQLTKESYELWAAMNNSEPVGLVGFRPYTDFVRGTHLFIDDLVVHSSLRSQQIGAKLLAFADGYCKKTSLPSMRLNCALENKRGFSFYEKEKWTLRSHSFVKKV